MIIKRGVKVQLVVFLLITVLGIGYTARRPTRARPSGLLKIRDRLRTGDRRDGDRAASSIGARSP